MKKLVAVFVLLVSLAIGVLSPILAQTTPTTCPHQQACELLAQANALAARYGLSPAQVNQLVPSLVNQDAKAIGAFLTKAGLTPE